MKTAENRSEMKELLTCVEHLLADVRDTLAAIEANRKRRPVTWCPCGCVTLGDVQCPACVREAGDGKGYKIMGTKSWGGGGGRRADDRGQRTDEGKG